MSEPLPPATATLWHRLEDEPALGGFYLLGGTALTLRIAHRHSEDLDLAWPGPRLPRARLDALVRKLEEEGWEMRRIDSAEAYDEFLVAGMKLHDYQQDFLASREEGSVKLSFFVPSGLLQELLKPTNDRKVVVPDLSVLFKTKALVTSDRSTVRDWFDLYVLLTEHGFTIEDYAAAYGEKGKQVMEVGLQRLASGHPRPNDPGVHSLRQQESTLEEMTAYFRVEIRRWELAVAERKFREGEGKP